MSALVIYHADCYDGFTSAWIARQAMPDCELFEGRYGEAPPYANASGRDVYILDFSYPREQMLQLNEAAASLLVLDHHKTAEANCKGLDFCEFDMDRSGCGMTWDHFFPDIIETPRPGWIEYVEDRDLWRFEYSATKDVHAFMASIPMTMENWDRIAGTPLLEMTSKGCAIRGYIETYIEKAVKESRLVSIDGHSVAVLNVPYQNASETADAMLSAHPDASYSMSYFQRGDTQWQYSLRSRSNFDVSEIAKLHGGGGHAQAAGFETAEILSVLLGISR